MLVQHVLSGKRDHLPEKEYYAEPCVSVLHHPAKTEQEGVKSGRRVNHWQCHDHIMAEEGTMWMYKGGHLQNTYSLRCCKQNLVCVNSYKK